jgi:hypothetical protein
MAAAYTGTRRLVFELDSVRRRFCLFIKSKASKAEADLEDAVRAESVTVAGDGDQLADLGDSDVS